MFQKHCACSSYWQKLASPLRSSYVQTTWELIEGGNKKRSTRKQIQKKILEDPSKEHAIFGTTRNPRRAQVKLFLKRCAQPFSASLAKIQSVPDPTGLSRQCLISRLVHFLLPAQCFRSFQTCAPLAHKKCAP